MVQDQFDTFDLTDNEITKLENFPTLRQLVTLLVSNNRVARIAANLGQSLPNLEWLVLTNNRIARLEEVDNLTGCRNLTHLSLLNNPVTTQTNYRLYVIHKVPSLRLLDFRKVRYQERQEAKRIFGELVVKKNTFEPGTVSLSSGTDLTPQQVAELTVRTPVAACAPLQSLPSFAPASPLYLFCPFSQCASHLSRLACYLALSDLLLTTHTLSTLSTLSARSLSLSLSIRSIHGWMGLTLE